MPAAAITRELYPAGTFYYYQNRYSVVVAGRCYQQFASRSLTQTVVSAVRRLSKLWKQQIPGAPARGTPAFWLLQLVTAVAVVTITAANAVANAVRIAVTAD